MPQEASAARRSPGVTARFFALMAVVLGVAALVMVFLVRDHMREQALAEAQARARLLMQRNLATHKYLATQLRPSVFKTMEEAGIEPRFDPTWMSSSYIVHATNDILKDIRQDQVYYKECSIDARNPENEADEVERGFLDRLNADPKLMETAQVRVVDGVPFFQVMRRGEMIEPGCMRCHGVPQDCPPGLVEHYGGVRGFGRQVGSTVSAVAVRIPLAEAFAAADRFALNLSVGAIMVLVVLTGCLVLLNEAFFNRPLASLRHRTSRLARGPLPPPRGEDKELPGEWSLLAADINSMYEQLLQERRHLEERVAERTAELERANQELAREAAEHRRTAGALRESEERTRRLFDRSPVSYQSLDVDGNFLEVNQTWLDVMGYQRHEVIGRNFSEFLHPDWRSHFQENFPRFKAVGEVLGVEFEMVKKDGSLILVSFHGRIGRDRQGEFQQTHCVFQDITAERQAREERDRLEEQLRQSQKMEALGTLAGGVAHDFNNLLAAIMGYAELARDRLEMGGDDPGDLEGIISAASRGKELVGRILTFSRGTRPSLKPSDLNRVLTQAGEMLRRLLPRMIELNLDLAPELPVLALDQTQIDQLVLNLVANARDAMPEGGRITVRTGLLTEPGVACQACGQLLEGSWAYLMVRDTGGGMDTETLSHALDPFFTTKEVGKGTGLGLSTVFGIVKAHGGHLRLVSRPGRGTEAWIYLPLLDGSTTRVEEQGEDQAAGPSDEAEGQTILVVDDEPDLRRITGRMLSAAGYRVRAVASGEEALESYAREQADLVILDMSMPGMGGRRCLEVLLARDPEARVVVATGYNLEGQLPQDLMERVAALVNKPFRRQQLLALVAQALEG